MEILLAIPLYMILGPFLVSYMLGGWSILPIGASIGLIVLASRRQFRAYWIGFAGFCLATLGALGALHSIINMNELSGPITFDLAFLLGGAFGWLLDLLLIGAATSFAARRKATKLSRKI